MTHRRSDLDCGAGLCPETASDSSDPRGLSWYGRVVTTAVGLVTVCLWRGCAVNEKNYELLSFFFDGVPSPNAQDEGASGAAGRRGEAGAAFIIVSAHSAYQDQRCSDCHGDSSSFGFRVSGFYDLRADVCLECHSESDSERPWAHAPVVVGDCLYCHQPHESRHPVLLRESSPSLCLSCHGEYLPAEPPYHDDLSRDCLDCHWGHGGGTSSSLKPTEVWNEPPDESGYDGSPPVELPRGDESMPAQDQEPPPGREPDVRG